MMGFWRPYPQNRYFYQRKIFLIRGSKIIRIGIVVVVHWVGCVCNHSWHVHTCLSNSWHKLQVAAFAQLGVVGRGSNTCVCVTVIFTMCESTEQCICIKFCFKWLQPLLDATENEDSINSNWKQIIVEDVANCTAESSLQLSPQTLKILEKAVET